MINAVDSTSTPTTNVSEGNPKGSLGKDDFLTLLLVELQYQDPTEPMDSEKILSQTSQLATLESAQNTNDALEKLSNSLGANQQFSTIAAIGKTADIGSNAVTFDKGTVSSFEMYFPEEIAQGTVEILDVEGNVVSTMDVAPNPSGVYKFDWDGKLSNGSDAESGIYYITASYNNPDGKALSTRMGTYPIESVRFDEGQTLVKLGSGYVPFENIKEIY
jgi:flagellar basal-body rod modification protein FlgD